MGWKTSCILCTDGTVPQYFATAPKHLPDEATRIAKLFGYEFKSREPCEYDDYPEDGTFVIGAYEKGAFLADRDIIFECFENREHRYFKTALQLYPEGELLIVTAHSFNNYFGYALYKQGTLIREYSGSSDDGVMSEIGEIQPEESEIFAKSVVRDGIRYFKVERDERARKMGFTEDEETADGDIGEELCFRMLRKYLGCYQSEPAGPDADELMVEQFFRRTRNQTADTRQKEQSSVWDGVKRLFGG